MRKSALLLVPFLLAGEAAALEYAEAARLEVREMADQAQIEDLVAANRILSDQGVVDGFGHVSARHEAGCDALFARPQHGAGSRHG